MEKLILSILDRNYGMTGTLEELVAYQDKNYIFTTDNRQKYVVKLTTDPKELDLVHHQGAVFHALSNSKICKPILTQDGKGWVDISYKNHTLPIRVFPFIEGPFLVEVEPDLGFYQSFGSILAQMDEEMNEINDLVLRSHSHEWDLARFHESRPLCVHIKNPETKRLVEYFFMMHKEVVCPIYNKLPKGLIHNDPNDWNIIVKEINKDKWEIEGIIDFGDMVYTARIHELAIALAYSLMGKENLLEISRAMVEGYHQDYALSREELSSLYYLIAARLCTCIVHAAKKSIEQPDSAYHQVSYLPAIKLLKKWIRINPYLFKNTVMVAAGFENKLNPDEIANKVSQKIDDRHRNMSKSQSVSYISPIEMLGSALQYMYAADGKTYLDCVNNIPHVGHCHPTIVEAGQRQMAKLNTNSRYIYDSLNRYSEKLLNTFPDKLKKVFFVNSGSAATDLAVRLAKHHTKQDKFTVLDNAYHGNTSTAIDLSPYKFNRKGGSGKPEGTNILRLEAYGLRLEAESKEELEVRKKRVSQSPRVPSPESQIFIAESIPGCAGQVMLDKKFMQQQVENVQSKGGVYIADEVQTGFARVGKHFWGFELYDIVPDIVILGKPIANGHPMGAVVCTDAVAESFETGMEFFSSFGGNPVSCEIANAVLDVIEDEKLQQHAETVGTFLLNKLKEIQKRAQSSEHRAQSKESRAQAGAQEEHLSSWRRPGTQGTSTIISDVRGTGLFIGIELVKDLESMRPDSESAARIVNQMKDKGFLLSTDGPYENVIKFKPPMCYTMENAVETADAFSKCLCVGEFLT